MARKPDSTHSTFAMRSDLSRVRAAASLERAGYRCLFRSNGVLLLVVEHQAPESHTVRELVFEKEPHALVMIR
jgi:hypothetical protein